MILHVVDVSTLLLAFLKFCDFKCWVDHFEYMSMQYTENFFGCKNENFQWKFVLYISYFLLKNRLWVHVRTTSMFRSKNKKNRYNLAYPSFAI